MRRPVLTLLLPLRGWDKPCFSICNTAVLLRLGHPSSKPPSREAYGGATGLFPGGYMHQRPPASHQGQLTLRPRSAGPQIRGCPSASPRGQYCGSFGPWPAWGWGWGGGICWELGLEVSRELGPWSQEGCLWWSGGGKAEERLGGGGGGDTAGGTQGHDLRAQLSLGLC